MKIEELIDLIEEQQRKELECLLSAISDWPYNVNSVEEYFLNVKYFLDIKTIDLALLKEKLPKIDVINYCWELESISELILFLESYKFDDLKILN